MAASSTTHPFPTEHQYHEFAGRPVDPDDNNDLSFFHRKM